MEHITSYADEHDSLQGSLELLMELGFHDETDALGLMKVVVLKAQIMFQYSPPGPSWSTLLFNIHMILIVCGPAKTAARQGIIFTYVAAFLIMLQYIAYKAQGGRLHIFQPQSVNL